MTGEKKHNNISSKSLTKLFDKIEVTKNEKIFESSCQLLSHFLCDR
ncbi:hypothetical protein WANG_p1008 (plasmid) [Lactobacillus kefiranofaciens subsp. kefiranofaciens]|nr:hypothetical protein WANG_p1008 [Lactobacillus kefiranofaciens subsp. kefiranofaciens]